MSFTELGICAKGGRGDNRRNNICFNLVGGQFDMKLKLSKRLSVRYKALRYKSAFSSKNFPDFLFCQYAAT